jgi:hypothetical protein
VFRSIFKSIAKENQQGAAKVDSDTEQPQPFSSANVFWPEQYLAPDLPQARIWTYGYNADVIGGLFETNNKNSISQHGQDLAVKLERDIDNEVSPRRSRCCLNLETRID